MIYTVSFKGEGGLVTSTIQAYPKPPPLPYFCLWFWGSKKETEYRKSLEVQQWLKHRKRGPSQGFLSVIQWAFFNERNKAALYYKKHTTSRYATRYHLLSITVSLSLLMTVVSITWSTCLSFQDLMIDAPTAVSAISSSHSGRPFGTKYVQHPLLPLAV